MSDKSYECTCDKWKKNIGYLDNALVLAWTHGITYKGDEFEYCPWCGEMLRPMGMDMVAEPVVQD